jgi:FkbM family methyltransferase
MGDRMKVAAAHLTRSIVTYVPPKRRGLRLANLSEGAFGRPARPIMGVHETGARLLCDLNDSVQRSLFYSGTYEPALTKVIQASLRPGDLFLDVGANVGHYSLLVAKLLGSTAKVHAIEASQQTADLLRETVTRNQLEDKITVHQIAASNRNGRMVLATPKESTCYMAMRHLAPEGGPGEMVDVVRLDEYLNVVPTVVKIDIEGADFRALIGMDRFFRESPPRCVFVEAMDEQLARFGDNTKDMIEYMSSVGYRAEPLTAQYYANTVIFRHK